MRTVLCSFVQYHWLKFHFYGFCLTCHIHIIKNKIRDNLIQKKVTSDEVLTSYGESVGITTMEQFGTTWDFGIWQEVKSSSTFNYG